MSYLLFQRNRKAASEAVYHDDSFDDGLGWLFIGFILVIVLGLGLTVINDALGTTKREVIMAKVASAEVRKPAKSSTRYVYFMLEKDGYRWESNERIEYSRCPVLRYNVDAPIWLDTHTGFFTGRSSGSTSGMITFCTQ